MSDEGSILERLGVGRVINGFGAITLLGASSMSPRVMRAVEEANDTYVAIHELRDRAGDVIASILGCEAATVTSGTHDGLALSVAAVVAGTRREAIARLPDVSGLPHEILIQAPVRWAYARAVTQTGARLRPVGTPDRCTLEELDAAIGPSTAAIVHVATSSSPPGSQVVDLERLIEVGRRRGIPIIVDAAGQNYPLDATFRWHAQHGDLVCFGAKYVNGPNAAGYICGRRDLIEAVRWQDFISFDEMAQAGTTGGLGRGSKVDRSGIVAAVASLEEWFDMDHDAWRDRLRADLRLVEHAIRDLPFVDLSWPGHHDGSDGGGVWLRIRLADAAPRPALDVVEDMAAGDPPVWMAWTDRYPGHFSIGSGKPQGWSDGDAAIVAARLRTTLTATSPPVRHRSFHPATFARDAVR